MYQFTAQSGENTLYYYITDSLKSGMIAGKVNLVSELGTPVGDNQFYYNTAPSGTLIIPDSIKHEGINYIVNRINAYAFAYCVGLKGSLTIPNSVISIGTSAFSKCSWLPECSQFSDIHLSWQTPPEIDTNVFEYFPLDIPVVIPCDFKSSYLSTDVWSKFSNYQENNYEHLFLVKSKNLAFGSTRVNTAPCANDIAIFEAMPKADTEFKQWSDGNTDNPRTLVVTQDTIITAEYMRKSYTVVFHANGGEGTMNNQVIPINISQKLNTNTFVREDKFIKIN